jgi:hypothetical protein
MTKHKWQSMTLRQKIEHIREYYTPHIIAAALAIAAVGWILNHYIFNPPPSTFVNISFYGQMLPEEQRVAISTDLTSSLVAEDVNYVVMVDNFFFTGEPQFDIAITQRFAAMTAARELDILIFSPGETQEFIEGGFARDLRYVLSAEEMARLGEMGDAVISDGDVPFGIKPAYFPYFRDLEQRHGTNFDGWMLIVMINSERDEAVQAFLNLTLLFYE